PTLQADRPDEVAVAIRALDACDSLPLVLVQHLEQVLLAAGPSADLAPHLGLEPRSRPFGERQAEALKRRLGPAVDVGEPALEAAELWFVLVQVLDQHGDSRQAPSAHRGEAEHRGLLLGRHTEERVWRICLVAVFGEPDRFPPEVALGEDEELREG